MRSSNDECPRCGAPLPAAVPGVNIRTCGYCHTTVEVHERKGPEVRTDRSLGPGRPFADARFRTQALAAGAVGVAVLVLALVSALSAPTPKRAPKPPAPSPSPQQALETPPTPRERLRALAGVVLLEPESRADALVALVTPLEGEASARWLTAREPATGRELWRRSLEGSVAVERILRIPLADTLIVALPNELFGLDAGTGQSVWQRARTTAAVRACAAEREFGLVGADQSFAAYSITTGSPATLKRAACDDVYASNADAPNFEFVDAEKAARWLPKGAGFEAKRGLLPRHGSAQVVLGAESNGAASAGVVSGRRWLWQANVASEDPELARLTTPPLAAVREECVVVAFAAKSGVALTALGLESGERRWTTPLSSGDAAGDAAGSSELLISRGGHVAYRAASGEFWVLSLETGAIEWTLHEQE
jgi:outer membrane protein assembly factor BamB